LMSRRDSVTSIRVHQSTLRALKGAKAADQTWDDFLLSLADGVVPLTLRVELDRRLKAERIIPGTEMKREYAARGRRIAEA
jgi:hypothetical protein